MLRDLFGFYLECFSRAFSGRFWLVEKWAGGLTLVAAIATKVVSPPDRVADMIQTDLPMYFFIVVFAATVLAGLVVAPYQLYKEEREAREALASKRKPKFHVFLSETAGRDVHAGSTSQAVDGWRQTTMFQAAINAVSIVVQNNSEARIHNCIAELISAECIEGAKAGPIMIFEPIALPWEFAKRESSLTASIEPGVPRRVWIAHVNYKGYVWLARDVKALPVDYQQIFGPSGKYRAVIQISDGSAAPVQVKVEIVGGESGPTKTYPEGEGQASIAILEQASPRLEQRISEEEKPR